MIDILSLFSRTKEWDYGLILSFDLTDLAFFEHIVLSQINVKHSLNVVIDGLCRQKLLYENQKRPLFIGSHYNLEGVSIKNGGKFHPKMFLFLNEESLELISGSFNLTENGFKKNLETVVHLSFVLAHLEENDIAFLSDLKKMLQCVFIDENEIIEYNSPILKETVNSIISSPFFLGIEEVYIAEKNFFLLSSENQSLFEQLSDIIGKDITQIDSLSPFYDVDASAIFRLAKSADKINLYIPKKRSTFPVETVKKAGSKITDQLSFYVGEVFQDKMERYLHAKRYRFYTQNKNWDFVTSANFSGAGLTNTAYPRNFEIGILFPANSSNFPGFDKCVFTQDQDLSSINIIEDAQVTINTYKTEYEPGKNIIKYAYYDGKNILFDYDPSKYPTDSTLLGTLNIGDNSNERLAFKKREKGGFELKPPMEIDGNQRMVLMLKAQYSEWTSYPFFVSRHKHEPSFLPAMGSSAFNECLRKGGLEGIELAFKKAKESGREDWLIYLLYYWDLEKILQGIKTVEKSEEGTDEAIPNTEGRKKTDYSKKQFRNNVEFLLQDSNKGLQRLQDYIAQLGDETDNELNKFIQYGLPIYLEITYKCWQKINEQEKLKKVNPFIKFPEYTWLNNVHHYELFFVFFINDFFCRLNNIKAGRTEGIDENIFIFCLQSWLKKMHTADTLSEFKNHQDKIQQLLNKSTKFKTEIDEDLWLSEEVKDRLNELIGSYYEFYVLEDV